MQGSVVSWDNDYAEVKREGCRRRHLPRVLSGGGRGRQHQL